MSKSQTRDYCIPITELTEQETIECVLSLYTPQAEKVIQTISSHIHQILQRRRSELREKRVKK